MPNIIGLISGPIIGILKDRIDRVTALIIGMGLAALGYLLLAAADTE